MGLMSVMSHDLCRVRHSEARSALFQDLLSQDGFTWNPFQVDHVYLSKRLSNILNGLKQDERSLKRTFFEQNNNFEIISAFNLLPQISDAKYHQDPKTFLVENDRVFYSKLWQFIFSKMVISKVASLMTILGESTMEQSGNMFLEIKNQERRTKEHLEHSMVAIQ